MYLDCAGKRLDMSLSHVMGILNVTPDSFYDGGRINHVSDALRQVERMVAEGASIIDVGGESTRPGAQEVSLQEELDRILPVIEAVSARFSIVVSVDTYKPQVMREAVAKGAGLINDIYGLRGEGAIEVVAQLGVPACIMHMQGEPKTMQANPEYEDVVEEVYEFFVERTTACERAGIGLDKLLIDPGFGFGKTLQHNLLLMQSLDRYVTLSCPMVVGVSRKSMIGAILDKDVEQRLCGSIALASLAVWQGANIIRAHDVGATVDALKLMDAVMQA